MKKCYHLSKSIQGLGKSVWGFWVVAELACLIYMCTMLYVLSGWFTVMHNNASIVAESQDLLDYSNCSFDFDAGFVEYEGSSYELTEAYAFVPAPCVARSNDGVYLVVQPDFGYLLKEAGIKGGYFGFYVPIFCCLVACLLSMNFVFNQECKKWKKVITIIMMFAIIFVSALLLYVVFSFFV